MLYMDIVGSSLLPVDVMTCVYDELNRQVQQTTQYRLSMHNKTLLCRPSGDGMALIFSGSVIEAVQCAAEISKRLAGHPTIKLRIGIHSGEIDRVKDINGNDDVTGEGIIMTKRIMDCEDAGHILLSNAASELLMKSLDWSSSIRFLATCQVKHGQSIALWNLYNGHIGNKNVPKAIVNDITSSVYEALRAKAIRKRQMWLKLAVAVVITGMFTLPLIFIGYFIWAQVISRQR